MGTYRQRELMLYSNWWPWWERRETKLDFWLPKEDINIVSPQLKPEDRLPRTSLYSHAHYLVKAGDRLMWKTPTQVVWTGDGVKTKSLGGVYTKSGLREVKAVIVSFSTASSYHQKWKKAVDDYVVEENIDNYREKEWTGDGKSNARIMDIVDPSMNMEALPSLRENRGQIYHWVSSMVKVVENEKKQEGKTDKKEDKTTIDHTLATLPRRVKFISPINDLFTLSSNSGKRVQDSLEEILSLMFPMFEDVYGRKLLRTEQQFQVITKIQSYEIPENGHYEGVYHREGVYENIIAVGLYYYSVDPELKGGELCLKIPCRRKTRCGGTFWEETAISVKEGDMVVFSNENTLHRVSKLTHPPPSSPPSSPTSSPPSPSSSPSTPPPSPSPSRFRKIIAFFLVDPRGMLTPSEHTSTASEYITVNERDALRAELAAVDELRVVAKIVEEYVTDVMDVWLEGTSKKEEWRKWQVEMELRAPRGSKSDPMLGPPISD